MKFDINVDKPTAQLREELGWWRYLDNDNAIGELVAVCMLLCKKIEALERRVRFSER